MNLGTKKGGTKNQILCTGSITDTVAVFHRKEAPKSHSKTYVHGESDGAT